MIGIICQSIIFKSLLFVSSSRIIDSPSIPSKAFIASSASWACFSNFGSMVGRAAFSSAIFKMKRVAGWEEKEALKDEIKARRR
jgi:hypothetical protein